MDTYRTEALTHSMRKVFNSQEPVRNMNAQQSYHSYRLPKNVPNFSIKNSITYEGDENRSSKDSLQPRLPRNIYPAARSVTKIKYGHSVDQTISSIKGMIGLPSIRNVDVLHMARNYNFPGKHSFM